MFDSGFGDDATFGDGIVACFFGSKVISPPARATCVAGPAKRPAITTVDAPQRGVRTASTPAIYGCRGACAEAERKGATPFVFGETSNLAGSVGVAKQPYAQSQSAVPELSTLIHR